MEIEVFRDIEGYEGLYQVSNLGNVKSLNYGRTGEECILKPANDGKGYLFVNLCKNGKPKKYYVHRLVALAFLLNPDNLKEINHKNEDKKDNCINNLEWCTHKYNSNYKTRNQRMIETKNKNGSLGEKPIIQYTKKGVEVGRYSGINEASRQTGIPFSNICKCCKGKLKSCGGFVWKYAI